MAEAIWFNDSLRPIAEAAISPFDHGITVGDGVFETLIAYRGEPFAFRRHHERLVRSASVMGLQVPELETLREASLAVLDANGLTNQRARVRITVTGGPSPPGSERGAEPETMFVTATPTPAMGETASVVVVPYTRNETGALAGLKSTSYGENVVALAFAKQRSGDEAIFANTRGELCEGTGSNIFLVSNGELITPPLEGGCLAGVTRALTIELCAKEGIAISERSVPLTDLPQAEEAFLTSTTREVQPIATVDGVALPVGPVTIKLRTAFRAMAESQIDP